MNGTLTLLRRARTRLLPAGAAEAVPAGGPGRAVEPRRRLALAAGLGLLVFALSFYWQTMGLGDLDQVLFAARAMLRGQDPYALVGPGRPFQWQWPLYYPGTAMALVVPLTFLPAALARALFVGLSTGLLAYAVTADGWHLLPIFLSAPFIANVQAVQWMPLLTAAYGLPALAWVWLAKPNFALPFLLARPTRSLAALAIGGSLLVGASLLLAPAWVPRWFAVARGAEFIRPPIAAVLGGPLLLLALLRWRRPEARLLLGMACVPQTLATYNLLPILLVPRRRIEALVLAAMTWLLTVAQMLLVEVHRSLDYRFQLIMGANVLLVYLPALWMVLRRPDGVVGSVPAGGPPMGDSPDVADGVSSVR